ncbi:putative late blight resistance protein R1B-16 [Salvia divinorum]|uniref:Late blight resistance protein R1B-16 n=1 Tax=Salvia divinorum TaxID=28513 RepID=A0ABD1I2G6_SALDI
MAYNLQPLITILEGILDPLQTRWIVDESNPQLQSLLDKATSLQQLIDKSPLTKINILDSQIREVAHQAEDILESHMVDQMLSGSNCARFTLSTPDLQQVTRDLDSVMEQVEKPTETTRELDSAVLKVDDKKLRSSSSSNVVVGIDADLKQLKERLTWTEKKLEIIPIVGMGGVGKTTIARKLYDDPLIAKHFPIRAWATISQDFNMRQILKTLLRCIIGKECNQSDDQLKVMLHKSLFNTKYLIVLDDIWSMKFWDMIRMYFPEDNRNNNGSCILITTRESDVANYANPSKSQHKVELLSESESWNLLRQLVFGEEDCPLALQVIGQKIASDCDGLPLAISVIGGLLSKMERSEDVWEKIGNNVIAAIAESDGQCSSILSLSYNHLPNHLKPCFLYMGAFPEDYNIKGSRLVRLWMAEGFLKSNGERSLEEEAEDCLKSLVERNLFLVREYKNGKPKVYNMHDMLRDLCIRKSEEDKFVYVKSGSKATLSSPRRVRFDTSYGIEDVNDSAGSMSLTRSVICIGNKRNELLSGPLFASRLLRVLDLLDLNFNEFPIEIFEFVNLRFLGVNCYVCIPRGISRLWNLQTFICNSEFDEPYELWRLSELRNLKVFAFELLKDEKMNYSVLKKLQIISVTSLAKGALTWDGFFKSIPNIKNLAIDDGFRTTSMAIDLSHLQKLEMLRCNRVITIDSSDCGFRVISPCNIRKLVLYECVINSGALRSVCALEKLEVLMIRYCKFKSMVETCDEEWEAGDEDKFRSLQFLVLQGLNLVRWIADDTNFPRLRQLCVYDCASLEEIPSGIGEISTLQFVDIQYCCTSIVESAKYIEEGKFDFGNYDFQLRIRLKED